MISVSGLSKKYGAVQALNGISFSIAKGEFFGLLGPNGAGKTTTISILSTIVQPDGGEVSIAGHDLRKDPEKFKQSIGVVPQEIALYNKLSAYENLMFWGGLYGVPALELRERIDETLRLMGLYDRRNDKVRTYSGGMKRRINIASAILHQPAVLFLDEPTVGIDPQSRNLIYEVLEELHRRGMTIVYTTHYMEEAERFCDRIAIIDNGGIKAQGTLDELKAMSGIHEAIAVTFANPAATATGIWPSMAQVDGTTYFYTPDARRDLSKIVLRCSEKGLDIDQIEIKKLNLETVFLKLTGKQLRD